MPENPTPRTKDGFSVVPGPCGSPLYYESAILPGQIKGGAWWDGMSVRCWWGSNPFGKMPSLRLEDVWALRSHAEAEVASREVADA